MPDDPTTIATRVFRFTTSACPDRVWRALTCSELTTRYLFGMAVESDWRLGSPVEAKTPLGCGVVDGLVGDVVAVEKGRRLSFTLGSGPSDPPTFVTWEIERADEGEGATVSLYVDETHVTGRSACDMEAAWQQAVAALRTTIDDTPH